MRKRWLAILFGAALALWGGGMAIAHQSAPHAKHATSTSLKTQVKHLHHATSLKAAARQLTAATQGTDENDPNEDQNDEANEDESPLSLDFLQPSTQPESLGRLGHYEVLEVLGLHRVGRRGGRHPFPDASHLAPCASCLRLV